MPDQVKRDELGKWHENPFLQIKKLSTISLLHFIGVVKVYLDTCIIFKVLFYL